MAGNALPQLHLLWNQEAHYWICITPHTEDLAAVQSALQSLELNFKPSAAGAVVVQAPQEWGESWQRILRAVKKQAIWDRSRFSVVPGGAFPDDQQIELNTRPLETVNKLVSALWLGQALLEGRIVCYLQPVMDRRDKVFGYESFARIVEKDGTVIAGKQIFEASADLQIEYMVDRYLHVQSIRSFIETDLSGVLFINFVPGFIHRPEKYLKGLGDTAQALGLAARHIVLDITQSDQSFEGVHLRGIFDCCLSKGYAVALDDVDSFETAKRLLSVGKADYMKLDMELVQQVQTLEGRRVVEQLVELAREVGCTVIAEGVESEAVFSALKHAGVDLFQGYYFSPPMEAGKAAQKNAG